MTALLGATTIVAAVPASRHLRLTSGRHCCVEFALTLASELSENNRMADENGIPTSQDVVAYLNERFEILGLPYRLEHIAVLPYVNPMWMANWEVPQLGGVPEQSLIEDELREARWRFPQVLETY